MRFRYYCLYRPPIPGTVPRGVIEMEAVPEKTYYPQIDRKAWGRVEYEHELMPQQLDNYSLAGPEVRHAP